MLVQRLKFPLGEGQPYRFCYYIGVCLLRAQVYSGHGKISYLDGATAFCTRSDLFHELHPEITSFDYSWSIASDREKSGLSWELA